MIAAPKKPTFLARLQKYEQLKQAQSGQSAQPSPARPSYPLELLSAAKREIVIVSRQPVVADDLFALEERKREYRDQLEDLEHEDEPFKHEEQQLLEQLAAVREARQDIAGRKSKVVEAMRELNREENALLDGMLKAMPSAGSQSREEEVAQEAQAAPVLPNATVQSAPPTRKRRLADETEHAQDDVPTVPRKKTRATKPNTRTLTMAEMEGFVANRDNSRGDGPIACQVCGAEHRQFSAAWKFRDHLVQHLRKEDRPFKCPIDDCREKFVQMNHVKSHLSSGVHKTKWSREIEEHSTDADMKPRWDAMLQH